MRNKIPYSFVTKKTQRNDSLWPSSHPWPRSSSSSSSLGGSFQSLTMMVGRRIGQPLFETTTLTTEYRLQHWIGRRNGRRSLMLDHNKDSYDGTTGIVPSVPPKQEILAALVRRPPSSYQSSNTTIVSVLRNAIALLQEHDTPEPTSSSCHLLSLALSIPWNHNGHAKLFDLLTTNDNDNDSNVNSNVPQKLLAADGMVTELELETFVSHLQRRMRMEPLQYICQKWDFYNIDELIVRPPCLCPRPETEQLVDLVFHDIDETTVPKQKRRLLDVGCGTGAIGLAIAKRYPQTVNVVAIDNSKQAIDLSHENARSILGDDYPHKYECLHCSADDFTNDNNHVSNDDHPDEENQKRSRDGSLEFNFDIVVANPPYIPPRDMNGLSLDVRMYEDYNALCGGDGEDGMDVIRDIVKRLPEWIGCDGICWMEVDPSQPTLLRQWLEDERRNDEGGSVNKKVVTFVETRKDFNGFDRFVKLRVR